MRSVKFRKTKVAFVLGMLISSCSAFGQFMPSDNSTKPTVSMPANGGISIDFNPNQFPGVPSYGGAYGPGIGASVPSVGIPTVDVVRIAEAIYKTITEKMQGEMAIEIAKSWLDTIGQAGEDMVDAINNGFANSVVRMNKNEQDIHNAEVLEKVQSSPTVCKDLAINLSMTGDEACQMMEDIYDMYNGGGTETGQVSALMTIAKGLNSSFLSVKHEKNVRTERIITRHQAGIASSKEYYSADRFISENTGTYDDERVKDFADFMFILMPPVTEGGESKLEEKQETIGGKTDNADFIRRKIDKGLTSTAFAATLMDRFPSQTGVSPLSAMREYAKNVFSEEHIEKLGNGTDMSATQLYRQMVLMKAFEIHKNVVSYERKLEEEQLQARKLMESLDPQNSEVL